jgi:hypothetical protein
MANIFDFFIDRDAEQRRRKDAALGMPTLPAVLGRPPLVNKPRDINALMNQPAPPAPAPALAPPFSAGMGQGQPQAPPFGSGQVDPNLFLSRQPQYDTGSASVAPPVLTPREMLNAERVAKQSELDLLLDEKKNPVLNKDHGFMGRLGDVLKQALVAGADSYRNAPGTGWEKLAGGVGGMAAGGFQGGFDPAVDERRQRQFDILKAQDQLAGLDGRYKQSIGEERALTDIAGERQDQILSRPTATKDPLTGEMLLVKPNEALASSNRQHHDTIVAGTAKEQLAQRNEQSLREAAAAAERQRQDREIKIATYNATAETEEQKFIAKETNDATEKHLARLASWQENETKRTVEAAKSLSEAESSLLNAHGAVDRMNVAVARLAELQAAVDAADPEDDAAVRQAKAQYQSGYKAFYDAQADVYKESKAAKVASSVTQSLRPTDMPKMGRIRTYKAKTITAPKPVSRSRDPLGLFQ